jgi:hypothetical protein
MDTERVPEKAMAPPIGMELSTRGIPSLMIDLMLRSFLQGIFVPIDRLRCRGKRCES